VRNLDAEVNSAVYQPMYYWGSDDYPEIDLTPENTQPFPANSTYIEKAKTIVNRMTASGGKIPVSSLLYQEMCNRDIQDADTENLDFFLCTNQNIPSLHQKVSKLKGTVLPNNAHR